MLFLNSYLYLISLSAAVLKYWNCDLAR